MRNALKYGATREETMEVLQLTSVLGVSLLHRRRPVLMEELALAAAPWGPKGRSTPEQGRLKAEFVATRGYWSELWEGVLRLSPEYFEAYKEFLVGPLAQRARCRRATRSSSTSP